MINPGGFQLGPGEELKVEEFKEGLFAVTNAYAGEYDYFAPAPLSDREFQSTSEEEKVFHSWIERVHKQLLRWDVQQVFANAIALLMISGRVASGLRFIRFHHSYPRHKALGKPDTPVELTNEYLLAAMNDYQAKSGRDPADVRQEIDKQIDNFLSTSITLQPAAKSSAFKEKMRARPRPRTVINEVRQMYPVLNGGEMLHEDTFRTIFEQEDIKVFEVDGLPLLSVFLEYTDGLGMPQKAVVLKSGLHQALRDFLIAHEMGHYFLHVRTGFAENLMGRDFYLHSSPEWMQLEVEADNFAMAALFPSAYLADCEIREGELTTDSLFKKFTEKMDKPPDELNATMTNYIDKRLRTYKEFKDITNPLRILMSSIKETHITSLLEILRGSMVRWVRMDKDSLIIDASHNFVDLFETSWDSIVGKLRPKDLVVTGDRERMQERAEHRNRRMEPICYYTFVQYPTQTKSRHVVVYSFPIAKDNDYAGSIGILIPLDEVNLEPQEPLDEALLA